MNPKHDMMKRRKEAEEKAKVEKQKSLEVEKVIDEASKNFVEIDESPEKNEETTKE